MIIFFFFGDLNIRLDLWLNDQLMIDLVKNRSRETNGDFTKLYSHDQFLKYENQSIIISEMSEAKIKFSPTYKYYIGSTSYDTTKRIPSWCDRIFYKKYSETIPLAYNKCLLTISDHQPIYGVYKIRTEIVNKKIRQNILNQLFKEKQKSLKKEKKDINKNDINNSDMSTKDSSESLNEIKYSNENLKYVKKIEIDKNNIKTNNLSDEKNNLNIENNYDENTINNYDSKDEKKLNKSKKESLINDNTNINVNKNLDDNKSQEIIDYLNNDKKIDDSNDNHK